MSQVPRIDTRNAAPGDALILDPSLDAPVGRFTPAPVAAGGTSPNVTTITNTEGSTVAKGRPVSVWTDGTAKLASSSLTSKARVLGVVLVGAASTLPLSVQTSGVLTATAGQWDTVTGGSGGLTPGSHYWLGPSGSLVSTPPTAPGDSITHVGTALSATDLQVSPMEPILI